MAMNSDNPRRPAIGASGTERGDGATRVERARGTGGSAPELFPVGGAIFPRTKIDDAIDRAVGDIMQLDPHPGLRRRVLSRRERSARPRILWTWGSWKLVSAAAVLMIIVAVVGGRWRQPPVEIAQTPSAPLALSTPPAPVALSAPVAPVAPVARPAPVAPVARNAMARSDAIFGARRDRVSAATADHLAVAVAGEPVDFVPPVAEQGSIAVAPIVMRPLAQMQALRIAPLEIQRITVPALSPPR